ncbi:MAG: type II toxin-antitoxin system RelE/ParE family toxin [Clostridiales bacterium]|jgi:mRNA interferase RelE/StbE|nr:type II toxin-antitoxin system RelE/ParE family toxin [Clostridiales bacterium]
MNVELSPKANKYLEKLNEPIKSRLKSALIRLSESPPQGDIKSLSGQDGYRLRIGNYRILFDIINNSIIIHDIGLRGQIYK